MRAKIRTIISEIMPIDHVEKEHIEIALRWIDSGQEIFRIKKPATPDPHLVCYFALVDTTASKILLVDHKNAALWLPAGGHVEKDEHPAMTVQREAMEELGIEADFQFENPLFITVRKTLNTPKPHTDVSLWYVLKGNSLDNLSFDTREFHSVCWFHSEDIPESTDPHMKRFIKKLQSYV